MKGDKHMNNQTHFDNKNDHLTNLVDDVSEGINSAGNTFSINDEAVKESNLKQAIRYVLWGLISVVVNFGTFYLLYHLAHMNYQLANVIAWFLGVQVGFWVDRIIVFRHKSKTAFQEMIAFYGTRIFTYLVEALTLWIGITLLTADGTATKIVGQFLAIVGNYVFSKFFIFKNRH